MSDTDKEKLEVIIHSEEATIEELLETQRMMRKCKEAYIERVDRQSDEINKSIDYHQQIIKKLKNQLK